MVKWSLVCNRHKAHHRFIRIEDNEDASQRQCRIVGISAIKIIFLTTKQQTHYYYITVLLLLLLHCAIHKH